MKMKFYDALQMDPAVLKRKIAACDTKQDKLYYWTAMAVRSVLIVAFAIVFISLLSGVFGSDNTPMAVALFCIMLGIRFVNFEYCIGDSLLTLAATLAILVLAPSAAAVLPPVFLIPLHFVSFFLILYMTTQRPEMGNGGLYNFAYIYLTGNSVAGEALIRRGLLAVVWYLVCAAILVAKHRHQHKTVRFHHVVRKFDLTNPVYMWQLRMALGVSLVMTAGQVFGVERFMWMGFACASLLPESMHSLLGPMGGLCLGFCTDYRYKTAMNCLGALMLGAGIYGLQGAVILRVVDTVLGVTFGLVFAMVFHRLVATRFLPAAKTE